MTQRILLKLSGEVLTGGQSFGIDQTAVAALARSLKEIQNEGFEIGIVIGGGNFYRGINLSGAGVARTPADHVGMLATLMNGILLQQALIAAGASAVVMSALECPKVAASYNWHDAQAALERGSIVIFVGGTGNPYFTTDTAAALRASEIGAHALLKATKVDGVYSADPKKDTSATRFETLTYSKVLNDKLGIMDATAIALCRESKVPIFVFNMNLLGKEKLNNILADKSKGTYILSEKAQEK